MHLLSCLLETALGFSEWLWLEGIMSLSGFWEEVFSFPISMLPIRTLPLPSKSPKLYSYFFVLPPSIICCSVTQSCPTLWNPMDCSMPGFPVFSITWSLLKLMSIESVMPSNYIILCCLLLLLPSVFPSIRVFFSQSGLHIRWPKEWSFSISPSSEYSGLISFRVDWFALLLSNDTCSHFLNKCNILSHPTVRMIL